MKKIKYIVCALLAAVSFTSCVNDYDEITQEMAVLPENDPRVWPANMSIGELVAMYDRIDSLYVFGKDDTLRYHAPIDEATGSIKNAYYTVNQGDVEYPIIGAEYVDGRLKLPIEYKGKKFTIYREEGETYKNLFTLNPIEGPQDIYIKGRIISADTASNIYKYFVLEDLNTRQSLKVAIDAGSLSGVFPLGQVVAVKCNGLMMGRYAEMPQLGVYSFRNDDKTRYEPGRIPYAMVYDHFQRIGWPDKSKVTVPEEAVLTMAEIAALDSTWYGRLIKIENVEFTWKNDRDADLKTEFVSLRRSIEKTGNVNAHQLSPVFAPSTYDMSKKYNIGYPMSREVSDDTGTLYISTSEYAHFAETFIPKKGSVGTVTAILGWFHDKNDNMAPRLDFNQYSTLTFEEPDMERFRNLAFAFEAARQGGNMPCILNAANEVVVAAFLQDRIGFLQMSDVIERTMRKASFIVNPSYEDYVATDTEARRLAAELF